MPIVAWQSIFGAIGEVVFEVLKGWKNFVLFKAEILAY